MNSHHLLIGPPGSGKSTFAHILQRHLPQSIIISTDAIRANLYGDASIQGHWPDIVAQVQHQCHQTIAAGQIIIYDATNAKRSWRFSFLRPLLETYPDQTWMGWHLNTPLQTCLAWNQQRERQVPEAVIMEMFEALRIFSPEPAEGMTTVQQLDPSQTTDLEALLLSRWAKLPRQIINRKNATEHSQKRFHAYSDLLAFERLLYLIKVILLHPGVGSLRHTQPDRLQSLLGEGADLSPLETDLDELIALLSLEHPIYGDRPALVQNLNWLQRNGFLSSEPWDTAWELPEQAPPQRSLEQSPQESLQKSPQLPTHGYSETDRFLRLMGILRFILHHPFCEGEGGSLEGLTQALRNQGILNGSLGSCRDTLRKDIQLILKPYGLLQDYRYKKGYFLGTGIFSHAQLVRLHQFIAGQANTLADPPILDLFNTLSDRLQLSKLSSLDPYPVRAVYNFTITNQNHLPSDALANTIEHLEQEILAGQCLELQRFVGVGRYGTEPETFFQAWPVQLVFHDIGWYLGYEMAQGELRGLLGFERVDRLFRGQVLELRRDRKCQDRACKQLQQLFQASGGLFLGTNPHHQQQWLKGTVAQRQEISTLLEVWCDDYAFRFISEGDQRFPPNQIKFSRRLPHSHRSGNFALFPLKPTRDIQYPHRLQVTLPNWALEGMNLRRWIWGFQSHVRVVSPSDLVDRFYQDAEALRNLYENRNQDLR